MKISLIYLCVAHSHLGICEYLIKQTERTATIRWFFIKRTFLHFLVWTRRNFWLFYHKTILMSLLIPILPVNGVLFFFWRFSLNIENGMYYSPCIYSVWLGVNFFFTPLIFCFPLKTRVLDILNKVCFLLLSTAR